MNRKLILAIKYIIILSFSIAVLLFAFRGIKFSNIIAEIRQTNLFWIFISFVIGITSLISRAYRWKLLIRPLGYEVSVKNSTYAVSFGYLANLALPRLGEVSRCGALSKAEGVPFNKLLGTVIVERIIDVISLLVCIFLTGIIEFKRLGSFFTENITTPLLNKLKLLVNSPLLLVIAISVLIALIGLIWYYAFRKKNNANESPVSKILHGFVDGLRSVANLKNPWQFIFHSVFIWFLYYLGVYVCLFALPATENLGAGAALFLLVAGGIGMSAPVQGGIGAYHLLVSQGLILYGLAQQDGLTFATLLHGLQTIMVVILGSVSFLLLFSAGKKKKDQPDNTQV